MAARRSLAFLFFAFGMCSGEAHLVVRASLTGLHTARLDWVATEPAHLDSVFVYRSAADLHTVYALDLSAYPITKMTLPGATRSWTDSMLADNCTYSYYVAAAGPTGKVYGMVRQVTTPDVMLPRAAGRLRGSLLIDKVNYFIELRIDDIPVKRFPVSLGRDPVTRKLHEDRMSTPEGIYAIAYFKDRSAFHRALGVNYPTPCDWRRYRDAQRRKLLPLTDGMAPGIGGAIQIHGGGTGPNWTWGCIAMRNDDIDQIMDSGLLKVGTPLYIAGHELTREQLGIGGAAPKHREAASCPVTDSILSAVANP